MREKFSVEISGSVELNVGGSVEVLKKVDGEGWVVEKRLMNMIALLSNKEESRNYSTLLELESDRPAWGGVYLSLFNTENSTAH